MAHDRPGRQDRRGNAREREGVAADCLLPVDVMMQSPNGRLGNFVFICAICPFHSASWVRAHPAPLPIDRGERCAGRTGSSASAVAVSHAPAQPCCCQRKWER
jgi:hypothetical protein